MNYLKNNNKSTDLICFHLYNDFSGSPKVLASVLDGFAKQNINIDLVSSDGNGILSSLKKYPNITFYGYKYAPSQNSVVTFLRYVLIQFYLFGKAIQLGRNGNPVIYVNTILPVGAAIAARLMGRKVVYHYHENAFIKSAFYRILAKLMELFASDIICVSEYQRNFLTRQKHVYTVPNALPEEFVKKLKKDVDSAFAVKTVLMLSSLKEYKGVYEFIELAKMLQQFSFCLVLNEDIYKVEHFCIYNNLKNVTNLTVYPRQDSVLRFYNSASIVLNLSNKNYVIETFGLTALEAMSAGLPVIVPTVGGIAEFVENGINGFKIDVQDLDKIKKTILDVLSDKVLYKNLSEAAIKTSGLYHIKNVVNRIKKILFDKI